MKFSDIHENLTEAPEAFDAKQGLMKQAKTKIKKKLSPTKKGREQAQVEDDTKQAAKQIKSQYNKWMAQTGGAGAKASTASFLEFAKQHATELAKHVEDVAKKLELEIPAEAPEENPEQTATPDDSADQQVAPDANGEQEDMISPEEMTGEKDANGEQSEEEVRAAYGKQGDDLEAKRKADGGELADESVEEDADDAEPKVDTSASIYEARLNTFLLFEKEMSDNQLDTLIVRVIQAAAKGGDSASTSASTQQQQQQQQSLPQRPGTEEKPEKGDGWRQKISKALTGTGNVSDITKGGFGGGDSAPDIDPEDVKKLANLLTKVERGKIDKKDQRAAAELRQTLKNTYG